MDTKRDPVRNFSRDNVRETHWRIEGIKKDIFRDVITVTLLAYYITGRGILRNVGFQVSVFRLQVGRLFVFGIKVCGLCTVQVW